MKRKVILHGPSTLTVSIPAKWAKKFNIKKGDELNLEEHDKELRIITNKGFNLERKEIHIGDLKRLGVTQITSSYRHGYDEISLNYNDADYIKTIQNLISQEITSFEIIKQSNNHCLIRDLSGQNRNEFDAALKRLWALVMDLSEESLTALINNNTKALKNITVMDYSVNKFSNYCLRLLMKTGHVNFQKTPLYYYLIKSLEEIADQYKYICNFQLESKNKAKTEIINLFKKVNLHLQSFHQLFYIYDETKNENLFEENRLIRKKLFGLKSEMVFHLSTICWGIKNLLSVTVEIKL